METMFTESERHMIDSAYHKMETGESITPEEMQLVIKFTAWRTQQDQESQARQNLVALSNAAIEFYERTCANG